MSASQTATSSQAGSLAVPTSVAAGSNGPAAGVALATVSGSTESGRDSRESALLLLAVGGALVTAGALRIRRS